MTTDSGIRGFHPSHPPVAKGRKAGVTKLCDLFFIEQ